jgi:hypothetical protein
MDTDEIDEPDEWTPEAFAGFEAAQEDLSSVLTDFVAAARASAPAGAESPELAELRDAVNQALWSLDDASEVLTGEFFDAIDVEEDDDEDEEDEDEDDDELVDLD